MMSATTQHLLGQLADGRFPLRKLLGVSQNSAVFLTSDEPARPGDASPDAAIKLIPEDPSTSDLRLDHWRAAAALSHPGLLRIHHFGRCTIDDSPCLYIVTELADEDLGQLLPRRALSPDETSGMLAAVLPTLDFLHENGFVHAGVQANERRSVQPGHAPASARSAGGHPSGARQYERRHPGTHLEDGKRPGSATI